MQRRQFFKQTTLAAMAGAMTIPEQVMAEQALHSPKLIRPAALQPGMRVALVTPSSPPAAVKFEKAYTNLTALGLTLADGAHIHEVKGYLAGTDEQRIADLHTAFADPSIDAIWCVRGGYGAGRLLPHLDYDLIRKHPKILIGYSDITALHVAIHQRTGLVTFHGQVGGGDFPEDTVSHLQATLFKGVTPHTLPVFAQTDNLGLEYNALTIKNGKATGRLMGGNLSLLAALAGTPFAPRFKGKMVFIEEIGEVPYRIDRMLTQLLQATDLTQAAGIALGVFTDCNPKGDTPSLTLIEMLQDRLGNLECPVLYGLPFGHISRQGVLPYGIKAELDTGNQRLTLLEDAVV